ncbi:hypothetical protein MYX65_09000, partial [Acidobacteria bacterium AH-259-L09]|nr:hypothetical protein [Acidobacteria bacterium AH-259-L09]
MIERSGETPTVPRGGEPVATKLLRIAEKARREAWSPNCPQHIKQRFTVDEMAPKIKKLQQCIADLEKTNASLRKQLGEAVRELAVREPSAPLIASLLSETPPAEKGCGV